MVRVVLWPARIQLQLSKIHKHIYLSSPLAAETVVKEILHYAARLGRYPEIYPPDKYRKNNDGSFRAFELYHYRISYRITAAQIIIVRIRHTKMFPKKY